MTVSVISRKDAVSTTWSGGTTTEFYLFPRDGSYKERRFDLRISSATVDLEASDFTLLPDYQRIITPLEGGFTLTYKETGEKVTLAPPWDFSYISKKGNVTVFVQGTAL